MLKKTASSLFFFLFLCAGSQTELRAVRYYADDSGSDLNGGTNINFPLRTIQLAIDKMMPLSTASTCSVFPGLYAQKLVIRSNRNAGMMAVIALSNEKPVLDGAGATNTGVWITNARRLLIRGLCLRGYTNGILLRGAAQSNIIERCLVVSNKIYGIAVNSENADNNFIISNDISRTYISSGGGTGLYVNYADHNLISGNRVHNNDYGGIHLYWTAGSNVISKNEVYSNDSPGGIILSTMAHGNRLFANSVWENTFEGIWLSSHNNIVESNRVFGNLQHGIRTMSSSNCRIVKNRIWGHNYFGIYLDISEHYTVQSNTVSGTNQDDGIVLLRHCLNMDIGYNLFDRNRKRGMWLIEATNIRVFNNTVYDSRGSGIVLSNTAGITLVNNILLANGSGAGEYGIRSADGTGAYLAYNDFYANFSGPTQGGFIPGEGNLFADPLLETGTDLAIASAASPVIDKGLFIPGLTSGYCGTAPDMGWKESDFKAEADLLSPAGRPADTLEGAVVAPNPFQPARAKRDSVLFFNLTRDFDIRVFTLSGLEVARVSGTAGTGTFPWIPADRSGRALKSGVYIISVSNSRGEKKILKWALIR